MGIPAKELINMRAPQTNLHQWPAGTDSFPNKQQMHVPWQFQETGWVPRRMRGGRIAARQPGLNTGEPVKPWINTPGQVRCRAIRQPAVQCPGCIPGSCPNRSVEWIAMPSLTTAVAEQKNGLSFPAASVMSPFLARASLLFFNK